MGRLYGFAYWFCNISRPPLPHRAASVRATPCSFPVGEAKPGGRAWLRLWDSIFLPLPQNQKTDARSDPGGDIDIDDTFHGMLSGQHQQDPQHPQKADGQKGQDHGPDRITRSAACAGKAFRQSIKQEKWGHSPHKNNRLGYDCQIGRAHV